MCCQISVHGILRRVVCSCRTALQLALQLTRFCVQQKQEAAVVAAAAANEKQQALKAAQQKKKADDRKATARSNAAAKQKALVKELHDLNEDTTVRAAAEAAVAAKASFLHIRSFGVCVLTVVWRELFAVTRTIVLVHHCAAAVAFCIA